MHSFCVCQAKAGEWRNRVYSSSHFENDVSTQLSLDQNRLTSKHAVELNLSVYLINTFTRMFVYFVVECYKKIY